MHWVCAIHQILCGAVEFSDKLSKVGTQPIIGTQINFKFNDTVPVYFHYLL
jgi:DNA polymerase III alpha subunit